MAGPPVGTRFFLRKEERLCSANAFTYLFEHGFNLRMGVLSFFYTTNIPPSFVKSPVSVAFSAPKRSLRKAVDRNLIKRRMREAYRLNKYLLLQDMEQSSPHLVILIKYNRRYISDFATIENAMVKGFRKLNHIININQSQLDD